ncbi:MAG: DUF1302 domain-containing protein, partial [Actinobacteria bacterium]|nr:DUF1302 domain-containing protein [Actinomycetota bacterium]
GALSLAAAITAFLWVGIAQAYTFDAGPDWDINLDNSLQYSLGWRAQKMNDNIGNHLFFSQGDYKFSDRGDMVTNRIQDLMEFQVVRKKNLGFRVSGTAFKDFAYDDTAETNPNHPAFAALNSYDDGEYSDYTKDNFMQGAELLDAFVFANFDLGAMPTYLKVGRFTQYWGNAFFFGFSNIAYSQHPIDYIKGFSQPGSEVKELFLPRTQVLVTTELSPSLSVSGQYFFEYRPNRYPEAGTYLGFFDILFDGPQGAGALAGYGITENDGLVEPDNNNGNFGLGVSWSPQWAGGDLGFYYRQFDEVDPWAALINPKNGHLQDTFAERVKLYGITYEKSFGLISTGFEVNQRYDTALNTLALVPTDEGATGTITNYLANAFVQLGDSYLWDTGILLAEVTYTHLNEATGNEELYNGVGTGQGGSKWGGSSTRDAVAFAMLFSPQWLQVFPGVDFALPVSWTTGVYGNPAYRAGAFYAQGSHIYSVGLKATYASKHTVSLQYNGYYWRPSRVADNGLGAGLDAYEGFGGNGPSSLNDRGWVQLQFKTSF